eukprot:TRINITY_DN25719_c0_g1_i1.p1 TRINITY_DN25719_c0_g1~~TRINITY_DN25719_c0_g1_i1.p1  ORF type:complete len:226 (+),score=43.40 TRINITY_DN25719_c0_g1_i1:54-731(+)
MGNRCAASASVADEVTVLSPSSSTQLAEEERLLPPGSRESAALGAQAMESLKGALGCQHTFQFENQTNMLVKLLLEEDPEALLQVGSAHLGASGDLHGFQGLRLGAGVTQLRSGPRPPQELTLISKERKAQDMKSGTILMTAAFFLLADSKRWYKVFKKRSTVNAGDVMKFLPKHEEDPEPQWIEAQSFTEALQSTFAIGYFPISPTKAQAPSRGSTMDSESRWQ